MAAVKSTRKQIKTELQLDKLKAFDKPYDVKVHYSSGLYIRVGVSGLKSYRWDRGRNQKPRHITYGHYPALPLKEARDQHEKLQERYRDGAVVEINTDVPKTIKELSEIFYAGRIVPNRKRPRTVKQVLDHDILPFIGSMKIKSMNTMLVHTLVNKVIERGAAAHAGRVLAIVVADSRQ